MRDGDAVCPAAGYTVKHVLYSGVDDTRDCSACSCGKVSGASCSTTLTTYAPGSSNCNGVASTLMAPIMCSNGIAAQQTEMMLQMSPTGGSCTPAGGQPTGSATPAGPKTFCCLP